MTSERRIWQFRNPVHQAERGTPPHLQEEVVLRFVLRPLAATAIMVLATEASHGASFASLVSGKKPAAAHLAHAEPFKIARPKGAPKYGAAHAPALKNVLKGAAPQTGGPSGAGHNGGAPGTAQNGGTPPAQNGSAPALPARTVPAFNMTGAGPAARVPPAIPGPQGLHGGAAAATAAPGGAVSGVSIKPHPSALVALGGAVTGKGTAQLSGTNLGPKKH